MDIQKKEEELKKEFDALNDRRKELTKEFEKITEIMIKLQGKYELINEFKENEQTKKNNNTSRSRK